MSVTRLSNRYSKSLLGLAQERNELDRVTQDVEGILQVIEKSRDLHLMLKSPIVKEDVKKKIIKKIFGKEVSDLTMKFMMIVVDKGREAYLLDIMKAYKNQYNEMKGIVPVRVTSSIELGESTEKELKELLKKGFDKNQIEITKKVDKNIIGGFILEFEDKRFDASAKRMLEEIKKDFHEKARLKIS